MKEKFEKLFDSINNSAAPELAVGLTVLAVYFGGFAYEWKKSDAPANISNNPIVHEHKACNQDAASHRPACVPK